MFNTHINFIKPEVWMEDIYVTYKYHQINYILTGKLQYEKIFDYSSSLLISLSIFHHTKRNNTAL